jgi:hypothetical protein
MAHARLSAYRLLSLPLLIGTLALGAPCSTVTAHDEIYGDLYVGPGQQLPNETDVFGGSVFNYGQGALAFEPALWAQQRVENYGSVDMYIAGFSGEAGFKNGVSGKIRGCGYVGSARGPMDNAGAITSFGGALIVVSGTSSVSNSGVLTASPGTTLTVLAPATPEMKNRGAIEASLNGTVVFDCNLVNDSGAVVRLNGGTLAAKRITQTRGATLQGFGGISGNLVIDPNAVVTLIGSTQIVGDVQVSKGGKLEASNGTTFITGQVTGGGTIYIKDGNVVPLGGFSSDCIVVRESGT